MPALRLECLLHIPQLALVPLDGLVSFRVGLVGMVKSDFELVDVRLKLLLDAESLGLGSGFGLQGSMEGIHGTLVVLPKGRK